jgi:hypothetical protein
LTATSGALRLEHQSVKVLLDQAHLPGVVRGLEILQVVAPVHVDEVELAVLAGVTLFGKPLFEDQVVLFYVADELAPDDERLAAVRRRAGDRAEPPRAIGILPQAVLQA